MTTSVSIISLKKKPTSAAINSVLFIRTESVKIFVVSIREYKGIKMFLYHSIAIDLVSVNKSHYKIISIVTTVLYTYRDKLFQFKFYTYIMKNKFQGYFQLHFA